MLANSISSRVLDTLGGPLCTADMLHLPLILVEIIVVNECEIKK